MNEKFIFLLFLGISIFFYGCATKEIKKFTLCLNGHCLTKVNKSSLKKAEISGCPEKGTYKGPGVEKGFFYPAKLDNGIYQIKLEGDKYIYVADIEVIGNGFSVKSDVCKKCDGEDLPCPRLNNEKHRLKCKECNGQKRKRIECHDCLKTKTLLERMWSNIFRKCKTCYGKKNFFIDCKSCNNTGLMPCEECEYTNKVRCDKCN